MTERASGPAVTPDVEASFWSAALQGRTSASGPLTAEEVRRGLTAVLSDRSASANRAGRPPSEGMN